MVRLPQRARRAQPRPARVIRPTIQPRWATVREPSALGTSQVRGTGTAPRNHAELTERTDTLGAAVRRTRTSVPRPEAPMRRIALAVLVVAACSGSSGNQSAGSG